MNRAFSSSQYRAECGEGEGRGGCGVSNIYARWRLEARSRQSDPGVLTNNEYNTISCQTCRIKVVFDNSQTPTQVIWWQRSLKLPISVFLESYVYGGFFKFWTPNLVKHNIASMSAAAKSRSRLVTFIDINTAKCDS